MDPLERYFDELGLCFAHDRPGCEMCLLASMLDELRIPIDAKLEQQGGLG